MTVLHIVTLRILGEGVERCFSRGACSPVEEMEGETT